MTRCLVRCVGVSARCAASRLQPLPRASRVRRAGDHQRRVRGARRACRGPSAARAEGGLGHPLAERRRARARDARAGGGRRLLPLEPLRDGRGDEPAARDRPPQLERMVSHYPSQAPAIASMLAPHVGVPAEQLYVGNGACEVIHALLAAGRGPLLLSLPTFSAYYEFARGPVITHQLDPGDGLPARLRRARGAGRAPRARHRRDHQPQQPRRRPDRARVARRFRRADARPRASRSSSTRASAHFTTEDTPADARAAGRRAAAPGRRQQPEQEPRHRRAAARATPSCRRCAPGSCTRRVAVEPQRVRRVVLRPARRPDYQCAYEHARRRYVRDTRRLFAELDALPGVKAVPERGELRAARARPPRRRRR